MPRPSKKYIFDFKREAVQARFHELSENSKHPPRVDLCTFEEYYSKEAAKGPKKRTKAERENFLLRKYTEKIRGVEEKA